MREGRHLAAIMFVDMVGYSALMQESESRAIALVNELWTAVRPILASHGGREVDLAGDGMLTEFSGALAAARCALDIHAAMRKRNKDRPNDQALRVRAGLHLGDIEHRDGRIYGDGVNIAARLLALAPAGALVFTPHVRDQLLNVLERAPEPLGRKALKNIKAPLELWCLPGPDCSAADLATARAAAPAEEAQRRWRFGNAAFDERTLELSVNGTAVDLEKKSLDVLVFLLHHAGEVVTKDELIEGAWPGRVISDSALTTCIARLRAALGDEAQELIKTVHGFGYRLAAEVKVETDAAPEAPTFEFREGDRVAQRPLWSLVRHLGGGGHGEVWLARHDKTKEERVYKFALAPEHLASLKREITLSRLLNDAQGTRGCFIRVLDWNLEQPPYFIECEYSRGGSLVDWAQAQGGIDKVPLETRIEIVAQAAEALGLAHSLGVLHKDLKPANLLIEPEPFKVKLTDFGSGGVIDPERLAELGITRMGFTKTVLNTSDSGTALYLAPEVLQGQPWTSKADVYALGLILFQLVVGDLRRTLAPGWEKDVSDELLREDIGLAAAGNAQQRLRDAGELGTRLRSREARRAKRREEAAAAEKTKKQQEALERYKRRRWWTAGLTALFVSTVLAFWFIYFDLMMVYASNLGALSALDDAAVRAAHRGDFKEADRIFYASTVVQDRKRYKDPFGFDTWAAVRTRTRWAEAGADQQDWDGADAAYQLALKLAQHDMPIGESYIYWGLVSNHGDVLRRAGRFDPAIAEFDAAEKGLTAERAKADEYAAGDIDALLKTNAERQEKARHALRNK